MTKNEFLRELKGRLSGLPKEEAEKTLDYYSEMIDDRMDEGLDEQQAVAAVGTVDNAVSAAVSEIPMQQLVKAKVLGKRKLKTWEIVLIAAGFPVWFPLLISAAAVIFSVYVTLWALIISLFAIDLSFAVCCITAFADSVFRLYRGEKLRSAFMLGAGLFFLGASVLLFRLSVASAKGLVALSKKLWLAVKRLFMRRENTNE